MRVTFLVLLLVNLLVFIWGAGYLRSTDPAREPDRLKNAYHADRMRVLPINVPLACQQLDGLDAAQLAQLREHFAGVRDIDITSSENPGAASYWVAIGGLESNEQATRKQAELRAFSVNDARVVEDAKHGPFVVSIAILSEEIRAQKLLDDLAARGVRSARLIPREAPPSSFRVSLRWPEAVAATRQEKLQGWLGSQAMPEKLRSEACPAK